MHLTTMNECVSGDIPIAFDQRSILFDARTALSAAKALTGGGAQLNCAEQGFRAVMGSGESSYHWGAVFGLHAVLAAEGETAELETLIDSVASDGAPTAIMLYVLDALAGVPVTERAKEAQQFVEHAFGTDYESVRNVEFLWLLGVWHARQGDIQRARALRDRLERRARQVGGDSVAVLAQALAGHIALALRDTSTAIARFKGLSMTALGDSLEWKWSTSLPVERLTLAQLQLAIGAPEDALSTVSVFDHPGPLVFLPFLPESLAIRYRASERLGLREQAETYLERLRAMQIESAPNADGNNIRME
jgi:hypothetical protein